MHIFHFSSEQNQDFVMNSWFNCLMFQVLTEWQQRWEAKFSPHLVKSLWHCPFICLENPLRPVLLLIFIYLLQRSMHWLENQPPTIFFFHSEHVVGFCWALSWISRWVCLVTCSLMLFSQELWIRNVDPARDPLTNGSWDCDFLQNWLDLKHFWLCLLYSVPRSTAFYSQVGVVGFVVGR